MNAQGWDFVFARKGRRELTPFLAQEMLYDYVTGQMDDERRAAVETYLRESREGQHDVAKIKAGIAYAEKLAQTRVQVHVLEEINEPETYLSVVLKKTNFERWPLTVKWGLEALVVISVLIVALIAVPWERALRMTLSQPGKEVVLAEIDRTRSPEVTSLKEAEKKEHGAFEDDPDVKVVAAAPPALAARPAIDPAIPPPIAPSAPAAVAVTETKPVPPVPKAPSKPAVVLNQPAVHFPEAAPSETLNVNGTEITIPSGNGGGKRKGATEGILYRGTMKVANIPAVAPRINEKIISLGGRKAGEVEIGWKKTARSYYYHFTIPEAKYDELNTFLNTYGKIRIEKDKHPRVMPEGIIRLIITIDEASP